MFLKSIEIRGFKSFADKTDLIFKNGITAVVGPNGSGKSNISDAVLWVLGEQSVKNLRGGKMEDVIFAGTQYRKSVGLAQVSLILDNSDKQLNLDYSEVTVSRRLYRSGDSEYYINNTKCRLKDIQELFMDTGIGKEGYSIIGQGKIEAVLSGKPEERRALLEEAAGIVKFKTRKVDAEKKLENTNQNLVRINDILRTYEERLEPLRIESEKAKRFVELSDELKTKEINTIIYSIDNIDYRINDLKQKMADLKLSIDENVKDKEKISLELKVATESLDEFDAKYSSNKTKYYESKSEHQKILSEIELLKEKTSNSDVAKNKLYKEIEDLDNSIVNLKSRYEIQLKTLTEDKNYNKELLSKINKSEEKKKNIDGLIEEWEKSIKQYKNDAIDIISTISQNNNEVVILKKEIESNESKLESIKRAGEGYSKSLKINEVTKNTLSEELVKINDKISGYENQIRENRSKISKLNRIISDEEKLNRELNSKSNKLEANKNMLINLEKQYEGYNRSVKNLMQHVTKGFVDVKPESSFVLGEVIKVKKEFETAVEISLGAAISDIITLDDNIAKKLINYLKSKNLGRATFLPLNIIKGRKLNISDATRHEKGFIGIASELIDYDSTFLPAVNYVLGRTVIVDNMDSALKIAKLNSYSFKIVTLTGEVVNPGGSLTGGSTYSKAASIIGRKREIEELNLELNNVSQALEQSSNKIIENKKVVKELDNLCLDLTDTIHGEKIELTKIKERLKSIDIESEKLNKSYNTSVGEIGFIKEKINKHLEKLKVKEEENKALKLREANNNNLIDELERKLKDENSKVLNLNEEIMSMKVDKAKSDEMLMSSTREIERYKVEMHNMENKKISLKNEIDDFENQVKILKNKIEYNNGKVVQIKQVIEELENSFKDSEVERSKLKGNIENKRNSLQGINLVLQKLETEKHRYEINLAKIETESENLYERLNSDFKLTYSEAAEFKEEIEEMISYKKKIDELKREINKMGVVNVASIEEYKEVKEKYTFMNSQKEDLDNAKDELIRVIEEMTSKMRTVFNENFKKLNENFKITFRDLFKGGNADLILSGDDELNSSIEINVEPPGKKLQNINLMSGGEKGLSAIALLFAILKMKPTPFCILDEIEAALDDANVARYAEFLRRFSENTQFIVITHRKGTMEASDVLYGVTMEEKGVSKVISLDLDSDRENVS
ncbi:chromosome segregation protein [Clostridium acetobutylicum]|uniref:Chromosome partition protein Smc n=1 Tax=Clostridium acetobutylicum (strain ATCC 824 / DSM 792 / JCM 1419 / IAM 19013 / LMG 5710 / NBRC 13948 / NRRL B-527 / VKM B-1787 / 2291 / W) TaxID=272562 RepID=Q97IA1_CLOAB|nr:MULTISPECIES: chromosome segregation protein SMC [Clostridium]AAK79717.1 Chromosome segregation SMC protein, ATPase [Clostridium acetobutylicum ATCC 824]ADZ20801.1 Chromosome segregation SMC protein, ATPase [Clostridium acetobutylicum EA 2018]AEI33743.1 chromosome segregation SMC protein, ATPase [Clostridium acetobutylicum DSM 1731]AWV79848.1 chromosome segregation protein SMC [Clostridium acetobutylicum]MBC2394168.1 chromosome segregation protein SMC [Clostridium acetobutylicum]